MSDMKRPIKAYRVSVHRHQRKAARGLAVFFCGFGAEAFSILIATMISGICSYGESKCVISNSLAVCGAACGHHVRLLMTYRQITKKPIFLKPTQQTFSPLTRCTDNIRPVCMVRKMFFSCRYTVFTARQHAPVWMLFFCG